MAKAKSTKPTEIAFVGASIAFILGANTFRQGDKYAELRPGDRLVGEFEDGAGTLIVKSVTLGCLEELVQELGNNNHAVLEAQKRGQIDGNPFAGPLYLNELLAKIYEGPDGGETFTVITFYPAFDEADLDEPDLSDEGKEEDTQD